MSQNKKVHIDLPTDLEPIYSNFAMISHTPTEVVLDIAQLLPSMGNPKVKSRVVMSPLNAKLLLNALQDNLRRYEQQFGEIKGQQKKGGNQGNNPNQPPGFTGFGGGLNGTNGNYS